MGNLTKDIKDIINKFSVRPVKSLGQNFLTDEGFILKIADSALIEKEDLVIEIGPGTGSMTKELCKRAMRVAAIEIDRHLIPVLEHNLSCMDNITVINRDVLKSDISAIIAEEKSKCHSTVKSVKVVANLPYYITTPIIMKFLEEEPGVDMMVFMVQKEVAERMAAKPGGKDYGALSVAVQYYSEPELLFNVPPHCFYPQPGVDSSVVRLVINQTPPVQLIDKELFFKTVKAAFGQRRKTLLNALYNSNYFMRSKEEIKEILNMLGIDDNDRGEVLSIQQFACLANELSRKQHIL